MTRYALGSYRCPSACSHACIRSAYLSHDSADVSRSAERCSKRGLSSPLTSARQDADIPETHRPSRLRPRLSTLRRLRAKPSLGHASHEDFPRLAGQLRVNNTEVGLEFLKQARVVSLKVNYSAIFDWAKCPPRWLWSGIHGSTKVAHVAPAAGIVTRASRVSREAAMAAWAMSLSSEGVWVNATGSCGGSEGRGWHLALGSRAVLMVLAMEEDADAW
ncbi:Aminotransferase [Marssonina coronariae]|uniref:Aminotransferase n=1 Tax=Diplocarpon coronariae TaxID=2795749 RepID=A0A218Z7Y5_9HELO|nr:Aminotransferase [Marssonina coronariae]